MAPRVQLLLNGTATPCISAEINSNNYYQADTFRAEILPGAQLPFWCASTTGQTPVQVVLQIDSGNSGWTSILTGRADSIDYMPATGGIHIEGRDETAAFIDTKTFATFKNQTSSQIAATLAAEHSLPAQITPTTSPVERYYTQDHDKITLNNFAKATTEWDLLTFLAQSEGFDVYVKNGVLHFGPPVSISTSPFILNCNRSNQPWFTANGIEVSCKRALTMARDIVVKVQSWNSRQKQAFTVTAKATAKGSKGSGSNTQTYAFTRPNMTHEQAQDFANKKLAELSRHERVVTMEMPGEVMLTPRQGFRLTGTGTDFDMDYYLTEISRRIDKDGFSQTLTAKNQSPKDTSLVG